MRALPSDYIKSWLRVGGLKMADPFTIATIVIAATSTVQQVRVTNAQTRIAQWQSKEEGRKANLQSTQREVDRLQTLRRVLAQNNVNAAASGISLTSGTVTALKKGSITQFDQDQLVDRANTSSFVSNLKATAQFNSQIASLQNQGAVVRGIGSITTTAINANTAAKTAEIKSEGG